MSKLRWAKKTDPDSGRKINDVTTLIYNANITITDIPAEADKYMLGARSALAWIIDRCQVKKDKASGIVNDPTDWADEVGNPRYIVDLIAKVTRGCRDGADRGGASPNALRRSSGRENICPGRSLPRGFPTSSSTAATPGRTSTPAAPG